VAYEIPGYVYSHLTDGDIEQFCAVTVNPLGAGPPGVAAGQPIDGVAQMPAQAANPETIRIMKKGITFAVAAAAINAGAQVEVDAVGRCVTLAMGTPVGRALTGASGAGVQFALLLY